jgi:hypothetical protein
MILHCCQEAQKKTKNQKSKSVHKNRPKKANNGYQNFLLLFSSANLYFLRPFIRICFPFHEVRIL